MKSSSVDIPLSDTDNTDKTPCSAPGIRLGILVPGFCQEGLHHNHITQGLRNWTKALVISTVYLGLPRLDNER